MGCAAVGSIVSSGINAYGAGQAAKTQAEAADKAAAIQQQEQQQVRADLSPYNVTGQAATNELASFVNGTNPTGELTALENTPGYQFALTQGLKSTQNSAAARGLATSGAALKGAANYATGLAQQTYQQNLLNPLTTLAQTGEAAAAQTGTLGTAGAANQGAAVIGAGNASAAGTVGTTNAISGGVNAAASAPLNYALYQQILGGTGANSLGGSGGSSIDAAGYSGGGGYTYTGTGTSPVSTGVGLD